MSEREKTVQCSLSWSENTTMLLSDFIAAILSGIPKEHRDSAIVELETGDYCEFSVYFWRDETDAEMAKRLEVSARVDRELNNRREYYDRQEYARLKAKYEAQS